MEKYEYNKSRLPEIALTKHRELEALYDYAFKTAFKNIDYIDKPGWKPQLTCYPGIGIVWQWDSCFMTFITNYSNASLTAFNNLDNMYRLQGDNGYISMAYNIAEEKEAYDTGRINPPLYAWAEWQHYIITGDSSRFACVAPKIEGLYNYIEKKHRRSCGLYWFDDPGSSGMDNSPRGEYLSRHLDGSGVCFVDLACQQALTAEMLGNIYTVLGSSQKADFYFAEHKRICGLINKYHWDEKTGFYYDFFARSSPDKRVKLINTKTIAAAWTLLCGAAQGERFDKVLKHFLNKDEFNTLIPFASLSRDDLNYDPTGGYWLGSSWHPTDYVLLFAMFQNGYKKEARNAALKILNGMYEVFKNPEFGGIWEAYSPEEYKPATTENGELCKPEFVGWGGLLPIPALIEIVLGINLNVPENTVTLDISADEYGGIRNLDFGGEKISVICREYDPENGRCVIETEAEKEFTLKLKTDFSQKETALTVEIGKHLYNLKISGV